MKLIAILLALVPPPIPVIAGDGGPASKQLSEPAYEDLGEDQKLDPLLPEKATVKDWEKQRAELREKWMKLLGSPSFDDGYEKGSEIVETFERPEFRGTILRQPTGPETRQLVLVMEPKRRIASPAPGAVIPFYHPDAMAGFDLTKRKRILEKVTTQFGRHLVQQGFVVVCTEAFPYNKIRDSERAGGLGDWRIAAEKLLKDNPDWTGIGKLVHDSRRGIDLLLEQKNIDRDRIVAIGHSLGGKIAFYTGCLDERVKATVASDFGIGWNFTNWNDPWYLGDQILDDEFTFFHHQLLALHAPRSFLLVAGQYDKPESWQYLKAVKPIYAFYDRDLALGMIDHASGHQPTEDSMRLAYRWLAEQLDIEPLPWKF